LHVLKKKAAELANIPKNMTGMGQQIYVMASHLEEIVGGLKQLVLAGLLFL
jgi:hypothetical protein